MPLRQYYGFMTEVGARETDEKMRSKCTHVQLKRNVSNAFLFSFSYPQKNKSYRIVSAAVDKYTINTYYVWHPIWNGMRLASNVKNVDNSWTKDVRALCAMGKLIANVIMLGK